MTPLQKRRDLLYGQAAHEQVAKLKQFRIRPLPAGVHVSSVVDIGLVHLGPSHTAAFRAQTFQRLAKRGVSAKWGSLHNLFENCTLSRISAEPDGSAVRAPVIAVGTPETK